MGQSDLKGRAYHGLDSSDTARDLQLPQRPGESPAGTPRVLHCFGMTDRGRVRPSNEDQFVIADLTKSMRVRQSSVPQPPVQAGHDKGHILVVADGIGGAEAGEQASTVVVQSVENCLLNALQWFFELEGPEQGSIVAELQAALREADSKLVDDAAAHPKLQGMGTTVTLAYCVNNQAFIVHVGDSRCYLWRDSELTQITRDHTVPEDLVKAGLISPAQASTHPMRHMITNAVGGNTRGVTADVHKLDLHPNDVLLLCTDGLSNMVSNDQIARILSAESDAERACRQLVEQANAAGGRDNITVIVARTE